MQTRQQLVGLQTARSNRKNVKVIRNTAANGADYTIKPYENVVVVYNSGSYTQNLFLPFVAESVGMHLTILVPDVGGGGTIADNDDSIGYIGLGYLKEAVDGGAKLVNVEGVEPLLDTARSGEYPVSRPLYNYYRKGDLSDMGQVYVDLLLSDEGQALAQSAGFVPLP